ncbi:uncharacterized protein RHO17_011895 isoform 3-T3 [Thomomys bottae]
MVKDANKLTLGQELQVTTPHAIEGILKQPPDQWLSNAQLIHYQGLLLNPLKILFQPPTALTPASLLPDPDLEAPLHDCAEVLAQVHGVREDLQDRPLPDAETVWFTNGSSFIQQGQRAHQEVWPRLRDLYKTESPLVPHRYRPGDWVLVKCHRQENLEPRWKGPFQVILTTPTTLKEQDNNKRKKLRRSLVKFHYKGLRSSMILPKLSTSPEMSLSMWTESSEMQLLFQALQPHFICKNIPWIGKGFF